MLPIQGRHKRLLCSILGLVILLGIFTSSQLNNWHKKFSGTRIQVAPEKLSDRESIDKAPMPASQGNGSRISDGIPCLIHQSWKTSRLPSDRARRWQSSWFRCMPDCKYVLWTDEDNRQLITMHYPWLVAVYDWLWSGVQKADLVRYVYMLHYGGIYADIDTVCLRDFRHLLKPWGLAFGGMEGHWKRSVNGTYVQNSFMVSEAGHPFWLDLLRRIVHRHRLKIRGGTEETTGPLILMQELQQYMSNGQKDLKIFPNEYFNPFSWITNRNSQCKTHGKMSDAEESACIASFPNSFVVQMHSKSWGGGKA